MLPEAEHRARRRRAGRRGRCPTADAPLDQAVVIKLNGGLGTSMGMTRAKSLLEVKDGLAFLDVIARQVLALRERSGRAAAARADELVLHARGLARRCSSATTSLAADVPSDFVQNKEPKLLVDGLTPVEWPAEPGARVVPARATATSTRRCSRRACSATLLERGYRYAFMSNSDNLGAVLEPRILAWFAGEGLPVRWRRLTDRTEADKKGGHLARLQGRRRAGPARDRADRRTRTWTPSQDVDRHPYFNTNNLWIDLRALVRAAATSATA